MGGETITPLVSLVIAGLGILMVIVALAVLAVATALLSKLAPSAPKKAAQAVAVSDSGSAENQDDIYAVLMSVINAELGASAKSFRITEIKEIT